MEFNDIVRASSGLKTTDIKGKAYTQVNERVKAFRALLPEGMIETEIVSMTDGMIVMKATIKDTAGKVLATGHAYEREGSTNINKTSYIENCETSAVGRAMAFLGIGIDLSIASAEEVENAIEAQDKALPLTDIMIRTINVQMERTGVTEKTLLKTYGVTDLKDIPAVKFTEIMDKFKRTPDKS